MSKYVVIVDGYRKAQQIVLAFNERNKTESEENKVRCIHVQNRKFINQNALGGIIETDYVKNIVVEHDEDLTETFAQLKVYHNNEHCILQIYSGVDSAVELADKLSHGLELSTSNGIEKSAARRFKDKMGETIKNAGLTTTAEFTVDGLNSEEELNAIHDFLQRENKIVLKPLGSGGSDNVFICQQISEINEAYHRIIQSPNVFGEQNTKILVQRFLHGTEYAINTVTRNGQTLISDISKYEKKITEDGNSIYDYDELLPTTGDLQTILGDYVKKILQALGINNGIAHTEVKMILNQQGEYEPVLIETANRLSGGIIEPFYRECYGRTALDLIVACHFPDHLSNHETEFDRLYAEGPQPMLKCGRVVELISPKEGIVTYLPAALTCKEGYDSVQSITFKYPIDSFCKKTINLLTAAGEVLMAHEDSTVIEQEYQAIKRVMAEELCVQSGRIITINLSIDGTRTIDVIDEESLKNIKSLPSVQECLPLVAVGQKITSTSHLVQVLMDHESEEQLRSDYDTIQSIKTKLFRVRPSAQGLLDGIVVNVAPHIVATNDDEKNTNRQHVVTI